MNIKEARGALGLKQTELAQMLGVDAPLISKLENGVVLPNATMVETIEKALASHAKGLNGAKPMNYSTVLESTLKSKIQGYEVEELIDAFMGYDAEHPISRHELSKAWNTSDRAMRQRIEELRNVGVWILPSEYGGYYLCMDPEDPNLNRFIKQMTAHSRSLNKTIKAMTGVMPGQIFLDI